MKFVTRQEMRDRQRSGMSNSAAIWVSAFAEARLAIAHLKLLDPENYWALYDDLEFRELLYFCFTNGENLDKNSPRSQ